MKLWRATFVALMIVWLLAGLISGLRVFFVLTFLHLLLLACAVTVNLWAAFTFAFTQELGDERTVRGRPIELRLDIHNEKPFPFPLMKVHLNTADPLNQQTLDFNLGANAHLSFNLTLDCPHRGEYPIGMTIIDFVDLFGLVRLPFDMRLLPYYREKRLVVYPRLIDLNSPALLTFGNKTPDSRRFATDNPQDPFSTVRKYRPGDPRKLIHWKISLRQQSLQTRQFDHLSEPHVLVLLDLRHPAGTAREALSAIDACCEAAAAVVRSILGHGWPVRVISIGETKNVLAVDSIRDFDRIHSWLARVNFSGQQPFYKLLNDELMTAFDVRAVLAITHDASPELFPSLLSAQRSQIPIQFFFTGQAAQDQVFVSKTRQIGVPVRFFRNGDELANVMGKFL